VLADAKDKSTEQYAEAGAIASEALGNIRTVASLCAGTCVWVWVCVGVLGELFVRGGRRVVSFGWCWMSAVALRCGCSGGGSPTHVAASMPPLTYAHVHPSTTAELKFIEAYDKFLERAEAIGKKKTIALGASNGVLFGCAFL
jgi:hypothetical protein